MEDDVGPVDMTHSRTQRLRCPKREDFKWASEFYHAEVEYQCSLERIIFDASESDASDLEDFLREYRPSVVESWGDIGSITVMGRDYKEADRPTDGSDDKCSKSDDEDDMEEAWQKITKLGKRITCDTVLQFARIHKFLGGKWFIHVESGIKADLAWANMARLIVSGCYSQRAVIFTCSSNSGDDSLIEVFNDDFTDSKQVLGIDERIREAGFKGEMKYKPDIFRELHIFRDNPWAIRPSIYLSQYDILQKKSIITDTRDSWGPRRLFCGDVRVKDIRLLTAISKEV